MDSESKIKLKKRDSNSGVVDCLEKMSNWRPLEVRSKNFKLFNVFATCLMCVLIGICLTPALTQKNNKNIFVRHNQPANASNVKESPAQNNAKDKSSDKKQKIKKSKNKPKPRPSGACSGRSCSLEDQNMSELSEPPYHSNQFGNSVSNVLNGNFLAEEDDWFYYIDYDNSGLVYRTNLKSNSTELALDVVCDEICVFENTLYAKCQDFCGYLMTRDFFENQYGRVAAGDCFLSVGPKCLISCDESNIYKSYNDAISPFKNIIYSGDISMCAVHDGSVYFVESGNLYCVDIDGETKTLLKQNVQTFSINDSDIYYLSSNKLYSLKEDVPLCDISMNAINIYNGVVYFSNADDSDKLYSMNLNGTQMKKLSDFSAEKICVTPHKIAIRTESRQIILDL